MAYSAFAVLNSLFSLLTLIIIIDCVASWVPQFQDNKIIRAIHEFIYPILEPLRRLQDKLMPGLPMDFSPLIAFALLNIIKRILLGSLL
jgi:YggT family protein